MLVGVVNVAVFRLITFAIESGFVLLIVGEAVDFASGTGSGNAASVGCCVVSPPVVGGTDGRDCAKAGAVSTDKARA